jgi:polyisoprenoid-binding protein YceI
VNRTLSVIGALSLVLWTGAGFLAWSSVGRHVSITFEDGSAGDATATGLVELGDRVSTLHGDVRALAGHLGENLEALRQDLEERLEQRAAALEREVAALRAAEAARRAGSADVLREIEALRTSLDDRRLDSEAVPPPAPASRIEVELPVDEPEPVVELTIPVAAPVEPAARRKSFLAFELPSDAFRFDQRATWTVLPALSRVGFDAKSTLHDFSGVTSEVSGTLEVDPSRPQLDPRGSITVQAASLLTGVDGRDEALRDHLSTHDHPEIGFELTGFETEALDAEAWTVAGTVQGNMTIRGKTQALSMPVRVSVDEARRLVVEGEADLRLPDYEVPVPNKLGLISMNETVRIWLALKLRASARAQD